MPGRAAPGIPAPGIPTPGMAPGIIPVAWPAARASALILAARIMFDKGEVFACIDSCDAGTTDAYRSKLGEG